MITPPELRQQAKRLLSDAERTTNNAQRKLLFDLASKLTETAALFEKIESQDDIDVLLPPIVS